VLSVPLRQPDLVRSAGLLGLHHGAGLKDIDASRFSRSGSLAMNVSTHAI
jgi:hypothetical protein